jgi:hypothetical protein
MREASISVLDRANRKCGKSLNTGKKDAKKEYWLS